MIKIGKYSIKMYDSCNPFTVYMEYIGRDKKGKGGKAILRTKPMSYLNTLERALVNVYNRLQADSDITNPDMPMELTEAIELLNTQATEFKTMIKESCNDARV